MNHVLWIRAGALYLPIVFAAIAGFVCRPRPKLFAACLLGGLWTAATLPLLQLMNAWAGWWRYEHGTSFCGIPLELYFGWIVLWGILPQLVFCRFSIIASAAMLVAADLITMPLMNPVVSLGVRWLLGEAAGLVIVLLPALSIARWTIDDARLGARATVQVALAGLLFLYLVPELVFAVRPGRAWVPLLAMPGWERQAALQFLVVLALPGVGAVMEFAERGRGTPIPYDPPMRLVTSGVYRYCANPMQTSCALVMLFWGGLLSNAWLIAAAPVSIAYSTGIAHWDELEDLADRFGPAWKRYRGEVHNWWPRWRPYHDGSPARLYIASSCAACSELRAWLESWRPIGMVFYEAESLPCGSIRRLRYDPSDGCDPVEGVQAVARALEHLNLGWAIAGTALRMPVVCQFVQLLMDASGFGPRTVDQSAVCASQPE